MSSFNDFLDKQYAEKPEAASTTKVKSFNDFLDEQYKGVEPEKPKASGGVVADIGKAIVRGVAKAPDAIAGLAHTALSDSAIVGDAALGNMDSSRISPAQAAIDYGLGTARDNTTRAFADKVAKELPYSQETLDASDRQQSDKAERLKQIDIDTPKIKSDGLIQDLNANNAWRTAKQIGAGAIAGLSEPRSLIPSVIESIPEFVALAAGSKGAGIAKGAGGLGDASVLAEKARLAGAGESVSAKEMAKHTAKVDGLATKLDNAKLAGDTALEADISARIRKANEWTAKKELANNAEKAATRQDLAIAGLGNFTLEGQGASDSARQQFNNLPDDELRKNPEFVNLENQYGFEQAKKIASEATGNKAYAPAAALGSVASLGTGGGLEGALMRGFKDTAKDGIVKAGLKGGFKEGSEEFIQGGSGQFAENTALNPYTGVDSMEGVAAAAGEGAAMGFLTGGGGSVVGAAYDKYAQSKAQADILKKQALSQTGLSAAATQGQAASAQADADTHLANAQGLQDGTIAPVQPEPVAEAPSALPKITPDVHTHISNVLDSSYQDYVKKGDKAALNKGAIQSAANDLGVSYDPSKESTADILVKSRKALQNYNIANIDPVAIEHAQDTISKINEKSAQGLPPTNVDNYNLSIAAEKLGTKPDLNALQSTIDKHLELNAKPAPENPVSPTATNPLADGSTESSLQPDSNAGVTSEAKPAPVGKADTAKPITPKWIERQADSDVIKNPNNFGNLSFKTTKEANDFIATHGLKNHSPAKDGYGGYEIHSKKFAEANKQKQDADIPDALKPSGEYHSAIPSLLNDLEKGGGIVVDSNNRRSQSVNPTWFKDGFILDGNTTPEKVTTITDAIQKYADIKDGKRKDDLTGKDHRILQKLTDILTEDERANSVESEDIRSDEVKSAHKFIDEYENGDYDQEQSIGQDLLHARATDNKINPEDYRNSTGIYDNSEIYKELKRKTGYNTNNATDTQPNTAQPESPRTSENTADSGNVGTQEKQTVSDDTINQPTNKAQNGEGTDTTTQTTKKKVDEATAQYSKPDEETTAAQDGVVQTAESGSDASTQSSKTTAEIKQNAVSPDNVEQPEGIDTLTDELKQYLVDKGIFTAQKRNGKWTALIASPDLPKFLTDHQINSLIQQVKQDVSPDKTANKVFNELGFDSNKIKAINTLSNALAVTSEDRIRNEHLIKQSIIELQAMRDNGDISEDEFNTLTSDAFESNQVITKELQAAISAINNDAKNAGLGDWVKKGKSDYIVHVQPLDSTRKRLKSEASSEIKGLSAKELSDKIKSSSQNIGLIERTMEQLKKLFHKLFSLSKNISNENTFEPIKWLSDDGKTMFTVQKAPKTFLFFSDEQLASPDKIAQANELKANIKALKSDDLKVSKTSANVSGKLDGATFDFDDSLLGNNPYLKTINRVVNHEDKRVPLKGFNDVSPDNIPDFISANDTEIRLLESALSNAKKGISDQKNITPKIARQGATATIKLLMAHKKSGEGEAITHHYRGLELTIYSDNGADYLKVGESTAFEININELTKVSALTPKIDVRIDSLAKKDFAGELNSISQQIAEVKQTKRELAQILANSGFKQYKTDQAKKAQESRWISQQAKHGKPEPDAGVTPEVKPKKPSGEWSLFEDDFNKKQNAINLIHSEQWANRRKSLGLDKLKYGYKVVEDDNGKFSILSKPINLLTAQDKSDITKDFNYVSEDIKPKKQAQQPDRNSVDQFIEIKNLNPMRKGLLTKQLNNPTSIKDDIKPLYLHIENMIFNGEKTRTREENVIKDMSRRTYNNATQEQQDLHEKRQKEAGTRTVYVVGGYDLGKTAYDYADYLIKQKDLVQQSEVFTNNEQVEIVNTPADKPVKPTNNGTDKVSSSEVMKQIDADIDDILGDIGRHLMGKMGKSIVPTEADTELMMLVAKLMRLVFQKGYLTFKEAAGFVMQKMRENLGDESANMLSIKDLQASYIQANGKDFAGMAEYTDKTVSDLEADYAKYVDDLINKAKDEIKAEKYNYIEFDGIKPIEKPIWEMTKSEFQKAVTLKDEPNQNLPNRKNAYINGKYIAQGNFTKNWWLDGHTEDDAKEVIHRNTINGVLSDGIKIPENVLNEYPELKSKYSLYSNKPASTESEVIKTKAPRTKKQIEHAENVLDESGVTGDLFAFAESVIIPVTNSSMVSPEALHKTPVDELTESEAETYFDNLAADIIIQAEAEGIPDVDTKEEARIIETLAENVPAGAIAKARSQNAAQKPTRTLTTVDGESIPVYENDDGMWQSVAKNEDGYYQKFPKDDDQIDSVKAISEDTNTITIDGKEIAVADVFKRLKGKSVERNQITELLNNHPDKQMVARIMAINEGVGTKNRTELPILEALVKLGRHSKENTRGFSMDC